MHAKSTLIFLLLATMTVINPVIAADGEGTLDGRELVFDKNKGNCLACHAIPSDPKAVSPGNIGPALIGIKSRYSDRARLRAQIWDATVNNPKTSMPPFGRNKILTEKELDLVVDYIYGM